MRSLFLVSILILSQSAFALDWMAINDEEDLWPFAQSIVAVEYDLVSEAGRQRTIHTFAFVRILLTTRPKKTQHLNTGGAF